MLPLQDKITRLRSRGFGGTRIRMHRAIHQIELRKRNILVALLLPLAFNLLLAGFLGEIVGAWRGMFEFWLGRIEPAARVSMHSVDMGAFVLWAPFPELFAGAPDGMLWWGTLVVCVVVYLLTYLIPAGRLLPVVYLVRACIFVQATALAYFAFIPAEFPYDLPSHIANSLAMSLIFMFIIPWVLGATYYVFNFPLLQKIALTALILGYFLLAFPMQYLMHAYALHHLTLLFMPLFYLVFGIFVDVMMFVAFYSWGMSWDWRMSHRTEA